MGSRGGTLSFAVLCGLSPELNHIASRFDLHYFRNFRKPLEDLDVLISGNKQIEPDTVVAGILFEIEADCRHRAFLKDVVDRGKRLVQVCHNERVTVGLAAL